MPGMHTPESIGKIDFSSPANLRIEVKGRVDTNLKEYLGGLSITNQTKSGKIQISRLEGEVIDQAALIGILNTLYNMRLTILKVEIIDG